MATRHRSDRHHADVEPVQLRYTTQPVSGPRRTWGRTRAVQTGLDGVTRDAAACRRPACVRGVYTVRLSVTVTRVVTSTMSGASLLESWMLQFLTTLRVNLVTRTLG